uniref:Putative secreted protein n=1 Tax=Anopheles marajoara TaxID=58244 RepID=A0A2M4CDE9_9DIPT
MPGPSVRGCSMRGTRWRRAVPMCTWCWSICARLASPVRGPSTFSRKFRLRATRTRYRATSRRSIRPASGSVRRR